jgi:hypothetical protein
MTIEEFTRLVGESIGEASVCWSDIPTGVFDSQRCGELADQIISAYTEVVRERDELLARLHPQ